MLPGSDVFERSIREQIAINQSRTPSERFLALCRLLDAVRAMSPRGPEAREGRLRALAVREQDKEDMRATFRRFIAAQRSGLS